MTAADNASDAPSASPRTLLVALLTGISVFAALALFAVYVLNQKPKFVPNLQLRDHSGAIQPLQASLNRGKPVLLHFWATWCMPCREELPQLLKAVHEGGDGLIFIPVAVDQEGVPAVDRYLAEQKLAMDTRFDPDAVEAQKIGTNLFPETWLLSPDGRVLAHWSGPENWTGPMLADKARKAATL